MVPEKYGSSTSPVRSPDQVEVPGRGQLVAAGGGAPVLPDDGAVAGPAGAAVPGHDRLPLVGDAEGGDRLRRARRRARLVTATIAVQISVASCSTQPGPGEVLGELLVAVAGRAARLVDGEGPHPGRAGVEGDHDRHAQTVTVGVPSVGRADRAPNRDIDRAICTLATIRLQRSVGRHVRWVGLAPPHARHTSASDLRETAR